MTNYGESSDFFGLDRGSFPEEASGTRQDCLGRSRGGHQRAVEAVNMSLNSIMVQDRIALMSTCDFMEEDLGFQLGENGVVSH